jgi:transglutaminase-like putative cysteine protease
MLVLLSPDVICLTLTGVGHYDGVTSTALLMLIQLGYDIRFQTSSPVPIIALLNVHPSRRNDLREPDILRTEPHLSVDDYTDTFGNTCARFVAPPGELRLHNSFVIEDSGEPDSVNPDARQATVDQLPQDVLRFLLASRYCETDLLSNTAFRMFGHTAPGWARVQAICDWVHEHVTFGYSFARPTKSAVEVLADRKGVCRDFQHLAIAFCRCLNIPARYATGYLGDIGVPLSDTPMDFSAWFEAYLDGRWWTFDARHNVPRIGRVLMAVGRDAADVAITTSFGSTTLTQFTIVTDEVRAAVAAAAG